MNRYIMIKTMEKNALNEKKKWSVTDVIFHIYNFFSNMRINKIISQIDSEKII